MALTVRELIVELAKYDLDSDIELEVNVDFQCGEYKYRYVTGIAASVGADEGGKNVYITTEG